MTQDNLIYWVFISELKLNITTKNNLIIDIIHNHQMSFQDFFKLSSEDKMNMFNLNIETVDILEAAQFKLSSYAFRIEDIYKQGIEIITLADPEYPHHLKKVLKKNSPPILYIKGEKKLLNENIAAVVGSRDVSDIGAEFAQNIARKCVSENMVIASGYARGVDRISHNESIKSGGKTIAVIPQGILSFKSELKKLYPEIMEGRVLVLSTFSSDDKWAVGRAMERNRYIYGLAQKIYVAESGESGGTWSGALEGLKVKQNIYVRKASDEEKCANNKLIDLGATAVDMNGDLIPVSADDFDKRFPDIIKVLESKYESAENIVKIFNLDMDPYRLIQKLKRASNVSAMIKDNELLFHIDKQNDFRQVSFL